MGRCEFSRAEFTYASLDDSPLDFLHLHLWLPCRKINYLVVERIPGDGGALPLRFEMQWLVPTCNAMVGL